MKLRQFSQRSEEQPTPLYPLVNFRNAVGRDVFFSIFLVVFLLIFRPFGLDVYSYKQTYVFVGYGIVTLLTTLGNDVLVAKIFQNRFKTYDWQPFHQILWAIWQFSCLGITNFWYAVSIDAFPASLAGFVKVQLYVVLCAVIPMTIFILIKQNYLQKRKLLEAREIGGALHYISTQKAAEVPLAIPFTFYGENKNESLTISLSSLIFLKSQDNYVEFVWTADNRVQHRLLRNTLRTYEDVLLAHKQFFRCHRAFLVNLDLVKSISGNAQGYTLQLEGIVEAVPVSRGRRKNLPEALKNQVSIRP